MQQPLDSTSPALAKEPPHLIQVLQPRSDRSVIQSVDKQTCASQRAIFTLNWQTALSDGSVAFLEELLTPGK